MTASPVPDSPAPSGSTLSGPGPHALTSAPEAARTARAIAALVADPDGSAAAAEVHEAVCAYTLLLREAGLPPEQVVIAVKAVAKGAGIPSRLRGETESAPLARIVASCITAYYRRA
jgi:cobalamin-dependent methionine synthase I